MIKISNLSKQFGSKIILNDISIDFPEREISILLGQSGSGKSVLLKLLIGLLKPDLGEIKIDGEQLSLLDARQLEKIREKFGVLFQGAALLDSLNVEENIGIVLTEKLRYSKKEVCIRVSETLEKVSLPGIQKLMPSELSGGMKKRVGLARAIITKPKYVLYDEPTTGLDPIASDTIDELIRKVSLEYGITSIVVTHDLHTVFKIGSSIAFLNNAGFIFKGSTNEFEKCTEPTVRKFIEGR